MIVKKDQPYQSPQILIVEASAGAGKTYALARRYIQLLISPLLKQEEVPLNTILAITFTNKAALEMKERILEFLKKIALDRFASPEEKNDILSSLGVEEEFARQKAYRIMDNLLRNYNFFQVQTIDSFINSILSGCAFKLNLSANFKTKEEYGEYLAYSLDRLIDKAAYDKDIKGLFHNFLRNYLFIENRTGWFPKQNILLVISALYSKSNRYAGGFIRNTIEAKDLLLAKKKALGLLGELKGRLPEATHKTFLGNLSDFLAQNEDSFDIDNISDFFKREDFPIKKGYPVPPGIPGLWKKIRKELSALCELESASVFNYYIDIFNNVLTDFKIFSSKDDVLFLEALNKEARGLFDEGLLNPPELYYRLACRFRHFLIDEFQDTSRLQWENLFIMVEEAISTGGSLFYVGDKKQAIYRFRGGEVSLIDSARERFRSFQLLQKSLSKNYRSRREIVEFNNEVFSEDNLRRFLMLRQELKKGAVELGAADIDEIVKIFEGSRQSCREDRPGGYVKLESPDGKSNLDREESLKNSLLELITDLRKRFVLKDIALLTRRNDEVELLTSWLLEKDIPVESEKTLNIRQNSYIKELVSFLKFLNSPIDNVSFASFITGDIFCQASGIRQHSMQDFIFRLRHKDKKSAYLYREFRMEFPDIWDKFIDEFFKNVGFVPLYELVISILGKFNVPGNFSNYQGFFMRLLELIKEQEEEKWDIASFLEFFDTARDEDLYVDVTESDSIKILTIHKSKGLEFPVVIIPFLEMDVKIESGTVIADNGQLRLAYIKKRYADFSNSLSGIYKEEYLKSFIDELNGVYVALTRAEDELYIFVSPRSERGFNLASLLLPKDNLERGGRVHYKKDDRRKKAPAIELEPSEYRDWIHLLKDEFTGEDILRAREKILRGEILHCILSFIGNLHNQDKERLLRQAIEKAGARFPFINDFKEFGFIIDKLLETKQLKDYFFVADGEVYLEKEIVDSRGDTKRIDRMIVKQNEVWVVDYKSSRENKDIHHDQVLRYLKLIRDIYPDSKVTGILIYLDDLSKEEVYGQNNNI